MSAENLKIKNNAKSILCNFENYESILKNTFYAKYYQIQITMKIGT